jgi:hypothetical protein
MAKEIDNLIKAEELIKNKKVERKPGVFGKTTFPYPTKSIPGRIISKVHKLRTGSDYPIVIGKNPKDFTPDKIFERTKLVKDNLKKLDNFYSKMDATELPKLNKSQIGIVEKMVLAHELDEYSYVIGVIDKFYALGMPRRKGAEVVGKNRFFSHFSPEVVIKESNRVKNLEDPLVKKYWIELRKSTGEYYYAKQTGLNYGKETLDLKSPKYKSVYKNMLNLRKDILNTHKILNSNTRDNF